LVVFDKEFNGLILPSERFSRNLTKVSSSYGLIWEPDELTCCLKKAARTQEKGVRKKRRQHKKKSTIQGGTVAIG
jgi:hypothetical protein